MICGRGRPGLVPGAAAGSVTRSDPAHCLSRRCLLLAALLEESARASVSTPGQIEVSE